MNSTETKLASFTSTPNASYLPALFTGACLGRKAACQTLIAQLVSLGASEMALLGVVYHLASEEASEREFRNPAQAKRYKEITRLEEEGNLGAAGPIEEKIDRFYNALHVSILREWDYNEYADMFKACPSLMMRLASDGSREFYALCR